MRVGCVCVSVWHSLWLFTLFNTGKRRLHTMQPVPARHCAGRNLFCLVALLHFACVRKPLVSHLARNASLEHSQLTPTPRFVDCNLHESPCCSLGVLKLPDRPVASQPRRVLLQLVSARSLANRARPKLLHRVLGWLLPQQLGHWMHGLSCWHLRRQRGTDFMCPMRLALRAFLQFMVHAGHGESQSNTGRTSCLQCKPGTYAPTQVCPLVPCVALTGLMLRVC